MSVIYGIDKIDLYKKVGQTTLTIHNPNNVKHLGNFGVYNFDIHPYTHNLIVSIHENHCWSLAVFNSDLEYLYKLYTYTPFIKHIYADIGYLILHINRNTDIELYHNNSITIYDDKGSKLGSITFYGVNIYHLWFVDDQDFSKGIIKIKDGKEIEEIPIPDELKDVFIKYFPQKKKRFNVSDGKYFEGDLTNKSYLRKEIDMNNIQNIKSSFSALLAASSK